MEYPPAKLRCAPWITLSKSSLSARYAVLGLVSFPFRVAKNFCFSCLLYVLPNSPCDFLPKPPLFGESFPFFSPPAESITSLSTGFSGFVEASSPCNRGLVCFLRLNSLCSVKMKIKSFKPQSHTESRPNTRPFCQLLLQTLRPFPVVTCVLLCLLASASSSLQIFPLPSSQIQNQMEPQMFNYTLCFPRLNHPNK